MKKCRVCAEMKPHTAFYAHPNAAGGRDTRCKECAKAYQRNRSRKNPKVQEYDRQRASLPHRVDLRARTAKRWRTQNPERYKAQTVVGNAIRDGKLKKEACFFCGTDTGVHAHHHDYEKPLDVTWLCPKCHHRLHEFEARVAAQ